MFEPPPSENCKGLAMNLEVKYLFPTLSSGANFLIYQLPEVLGMRKIIAHGIRMQKNAKTRAYNFLILTDLHTVMRFQSSTYTLHGNFSNGCSNPETAYNIHANLI